MFSCLLHPPHHSGRLYARTLTFSSQGWQLRIVVKRLPLGLVLIISASAALLLSGIGWRSISARNILDVGLLQHVVALRRYQCPQGHIHSLAADGSSQRNAILR